MPVAIQANDVTGRSVLTIPAVHRGAHGAGEFQDMVAWLRLQLTLAPTAQYIVFPDLTVGAIRCILAILNTQNVEIRLKLLAVPIAACPQCWASLRQRHPRIPLFPGGRLTTCHCASHRPRMGVA